jgi:hypothetical protein
MASGLITGSRQLGGSIGLAALATVAITVTGHDQSLSALADGYATAVGVGGGCLSGKPAIVSGGHSGLGPQGARLAHELWWGRTTVLYRTRGLRHRGAVRASHRDHAASGDVERLGAVRPLGTP